MGTNAHWRSKMTKPLEDAVAAAIGNLDVRHAEFYTKLNIFIREHSRSLQPEASQNFNDMMFHSLPEYVKCVGTLQTLALAAVKIGNHVDTGT
jgi:hypothetical protein